MPNSTAPRAPRFTAVLASLALGAYGGEDLPFGLNPRDIVNVHMEDGHVYRNVRPIEWDFTYVRFEYAVERTAELQRNEFMVVPFDRVIRVERPRQDAAGEPVPLSYPFAPSGSVEND